MKRTVKVSVSRTIQVHQFEPLTITCEETVSGVPSSKVDEVYESTYSRVAELVHSEIRRAIKKRKEK